MEEMTVSLGTNLVSTNEKLTSIPLIELYEKIAHANPTFTNEIEVLRSVYHLDAKKYSMMKKALPYFVCAKFDPAVRRLENFASTSCFVVDIDKIDEDEVTLEGLKNELDKDDRIAMMFTSPSGHGLKLLFLLDKPCLDYNIYSSFYKQFAMDFATEHHLENYIDYKTNDVTRACFLSADSTASLNTTAIPICLEDYVNLECVDLFVKEDLASSNTDFPNTGTILPQVTTTEPDHDTMARIRERLELNSKKRLPAETRPIYVPEEITNILTGLKDSVEETGVELYDTRNIQYGIKLMFRTHQLRAELNLFYGHRGFSVVESPKRGTSMQLNSLMAQLVGDYINGINA